MITEKDRKFCLAIFKLLGNKVKCRCGGKTIILDVLDSKDEFYLVRVKHFIDFEEVPDYSNWIWNAKKDNFLIDGQTLQNDFDQALDKFGWLNKNKE